VKGKQNSLSYRQEKDILAKIYLIKEKTRCCRRGGGEMRVLSLTDRPFRHLGAEGRMRREASGDVNSMLKSPPGGAVGKKCV